MRFTDRVNHHAFDFSRGLIHPNADFVLIEMHTEQKVIYVRYGVEVEQEFVIGNPASDGCDRKAVRAHRGDPAFAVEAHGDSPGFAIEMESHLRRTLVREFKLEGPKLQRVR
jgi:hypothetical protein